MSTRPIDLIVVHCSATPNGRPHTARDIDGWHRSAGFKRSPSLIGNNEPTLLHIGYHYVVYVDGNVNLGRGEREPGAHVRGHNARSIGICMIGTDEFAAEQWAALKVLVEALKKRYPAARVCGHRDLSPDLNGNGVIEPNEWVKRCPGFDVAAWVERGMKPLLTEADRAAELEEAARLVARLNQHARLA